MNKLNTSVYLSLKDYQETYEFYRSREDIPDVLKLKLIQRLWNKDVGEESIAA